MEPLPLGGPTSSPAMTYPRKLLVLGAMLHKAIRLHRSVVSIMRFGRHVSRASARI